MTSSLSCRRCGAALDDVPSSGLDQRWHSGGVTGVEGRRCARCSWANAALTGPAYQIDLSGLPAFVGLREGDLVDAEDIPTVRRQMRLARSAVASALRTAVLDRPAWALEWLLRGLTCVGPFRTSEDHQRVIAVQHLYACLLATGPLRLLTERSQGDPPRAWQLEIIVLTGLARRLAEVSRELEAGTLSEVSIQSGILRAWPSEELLRILEANLNRRVDQDPGDDEPILRGVDDVEELVYGASVRGLLLQLLDTPSSKRRSTVVEDRGLVVVDLDSPDPAVEQMQHYLLLTAERWRSRSVPSFFFADERGVYRSEHQLVLAAGEADWLETAPLLHGSWGEAGVAITTSGLLAHAYSRAVAAPSGRLHLATRAAARLARSDRLPRSDIGAVRRQAREVHSEFERLAARRLATAGLRAAAGVDSIGGRPLSCGEIDVLAAGTGPSGPVVVVAECKNLDYNYFKDGGVAETQGVMEHALAQVDRKRTFVAQNWRTVSDLLGAPRVEPQILAAIVTRTLALPSARSDVPIVPVADLDGLAVLLRSTRREEWRPDLRRALSTVSSVLTSVPSPQPSAASRGRRTS